MSQLFAEVTGHDRTVKIDCSYEAGRMPALSAYFADGLGISCAPALGGFGALGSDWSSWVGSLCALCACVVGFHTQLLCMMRMPASTRPSGYQEQVVAIHAAYRSTPTHSCVI